MRELGNQYLKIDYFYKDEQKENEITQPILFDPQTKQKLIINQIMQEIFDDCCETPLEELDLFRNSLVRHKEYLEDGTISFHIRFARYYCPRAYQLSIKQLSGLNYLLLSENLVFYEDEEYLFGKFSFKHNQDQDEDQNLYETLKSFLIEKMSLMVYMIESSTLWEQAEKFVEKTYFA